MRGAYTPICLIDYALKYTCGLFNFSPLSVSGSTGQSPHELDLGKTPDISEYTVFQLYRFIWY